MLPVERKTRRARICPDNVYNFKSLWIPNKDKHAYFDRSQQACVSLIVTGINGEDFQIKFPIQYVSSFVLSYRVLIFFSELSEVSCGVPVQSSALIIRCSIPRLKCIL